RDLARIAAAQWPRKPFRHQIFFMISTDPNVERNYCRRPFSLVQANSRSSQADFKNIAPAMNEISTKKTITPRLLKRF
ncbi:hypothetical protein ACC718_38265, partial [Rhizobium ruizarguesonis]